MGKSRAIYFLLCLTLLITLVGGFVAIQTSVRAQDTTTTTPTPTPTSTPESTPVATATPTPTPTQPLLVLKCTVPSYSDNSGATFNYDLNFEYSGKDHITINLASTIPQGWNSYISYSSKQVTSIDMDPSQYPPATATATLYLSPNAGTTPDPKDYKVEVTATAGDLSQTLELTATVRAKYTYAMTSDSGRLSLNATAGEQNHFTLDLNNTSSVALTNIAFNATKPDTWSVTFNPDKIDSLDVGQTKQVDVIITPPSGKTIAGDYMITLRSNNEKVSASMDVRVTALTPSIWGYVGIIIVVVVIAGIVVLFMKLGRR